MQFDEQDPNIFHLNESEQRISGLPTPVDIRVVNLHEVRCDADAELNSAQAAVYRAITHRQRTESMLRFQRAQERSGLLQNIIREVATKLQADLLVSETEQFLQDK